MNDDDDDEAEECWECGVPSDYLEEMADGEMLCPYCAEQRVLTEEARP